MGKADRLSRRPDWQEEVDKNNKDRTLIRPEWVRGVEIVIEEGDLRKRIKKAQEGNEKVVKAVEELKKAGVKMLRDEEWEIEDRIVLKKGRMYVLEEKLRREVIQLHHIHPSRRAWRKIEDDRAGYQKLLVAGSNKRNREICG